MPPRSAYSLPLTALPTGYQSSERALSVSSSPSECGDAIHDRDQFLGCPRCVICGEQSSAIRIVKESQEDLVSHLWYRRARLPPECQAYPYLRSRISTSCTCPPVVRPQTSQLDPFEGQAASGTRPAQRRRAVLKPLHHVQR